MLGCLRLDEANNFESGVVMKTMANAVKYDRLAGGDCMSATTCFGCFRGNWSELETDINDWELLHVSGLLAGFGGTRLVVLLLSEFLG